MTASLDGTERYSWTIARVGLWWWPVCVTHCIGVPSGVGARVTAFCVFAFHVSVKRI